MNRYYVLQAYDPTEGFFVEVSRDDELKRVVTEALEDIQGGELQYFTQKPNGHFDVDWYDDALGEVFIWKVIPQHDQITYQSWSVAHGEAA